MYWIMLQVIWFSIEQFQIIYCLDKPTLAHWKLKKETKKNEEH